MKVTVIRQTKAVKGLIVLSSSMILITDNVWDLGLCSTTSKQWMYSSSFCCTHPLESCHINFIDLCSTTAGLSVL